MDTEASAEWLSLFNKNVYKIWLDERKELRKAAMLVHALGQEFQRIQGIAEMELLSLRQQLSASDNNCTNENGPQSIEKDQDLTSPVQNLKLGCFTTENFSPDLFHVANESSALNMNVQTDTIVSISSDEEVANSVAKSPTLNRSKNLNSFKKSRIRPSPSLLNMSNESITSRNYIQLDYSHHTPTSLKKFDACESTIIESTPQRHPVPKKLKQSKLCLKTSKYNVSRGTTKKHSLTQLVKRLNRNSQNTNFDETCLDVKTEYEPNGTLNDVTNCSLIDDKIWPATKAKNSFVDNYDKIPHYKSPEAKYAYKEKVVRGKKRLELQGWDCKECKKFYENLSMDPNSIQLRKDKCSRHRSKFAPANDTPNGYWDITIKSTPDTENNSFVFNI